MSETLFYFIIFIIVGVLQWNHMNHGEPEAKLKKILKGWNTTNKRHLENLQYELNHISDIYWSKEQDLLQVSLFFNVVKEYDNELYLIADTFSPNEKLDYKKIVCLGLAQKLEDQAQIWCKGNISDTPEGIIAAMLKEEHYL